MRAIPTIYRGTQFRSRLEAQWAEFFDRLNVRWQYEAEGYTDGDVSYLPDFWLPDVFSRGKPGGVFFEVKGMKMTEDEVAKVTMLARGSKRPVIVPETSPASDEYECLQEYTWEHWDSHLNFARCPCCGNVDIGFYSSREPQCSCGKSTFRPDERGVESARAGFCNFSRWIPRA